jgi:beta-mannosidase
MSARRSCDAYRHQPLSEGWELKSAADSDWTAAIVPGTVAQSLKAAGKWTLSSARDFDAEEWQYRLRFEAKPAAGERLILCFDGLATLCAVSLNGSPLFESKSMFHAHRHDVTGLLSGSNELLIRFQALEPALSARRGRPRWRTPMVRHQQLRWARTTLLGRTPGWSPPASPVGPWRGISLERQALLDLGEQRLSTEVSGEDGYVRFSCALSPFPGATVTSARLVAERHGVRAASALSVDPARVSGGLHLAKVALWWPHTHGDPALYRLTLELEIAQAGARRSVCVGLGEIGFRTLKLDRQDGAFRLSVNGRDVFCRGGCWMPLDCISLQADESTYRAAIARVRAAGMNMLRIAGPTVYETAAFYDACDAAGVLVWQDFMFANMDYPATDEEFSSSVRLEASQQLVRLQARASLAVLCGNSEGAQQAAMSGAPRACWSPPLFEAELAALSESLAPGIPYCPSSTHGGAFPFQPNEGVTSYYGVGAYLKPLTDARRSQVKFASECLAFANVPEEETLALIAPGENLRCHHPRWKERVPRDLGAGWDFDDVRDHYLKELFRVDPLQLRYQDHARYLKLSRVASGEVMAATFCEWRRAQSGCGGALVWFLNDLWPGAGWGVIDSTGLPKAAYYHLKRVLQPLALFVSDEDCNGLLIHVVNDAPVSHEAKLVVRLFRGSSRVGIPLERELAIPAASNQSIAATDLLEGFMDLSYAFRFGPAAYDALHAALLIEGETKAETFHFVQGLPNVGSSEVGLKATAIRSGEDFRVEVQCKGFAQSVHVEAPGFEADDQYFHMVPSSSRTLLLKSRGGAQTLDGTVYALNASSGAPIEVAG